MEKNMARPVTDEEKTYAAELLAKAKAAILGCGVWGGNITNENVNLKHYMNVTWVSKPIEADRPSEEELFGEFYNTETF
jgi:hypothetical protein